MLILFCKLDMDMNAKRNKVHSNEDRVFKSQYYHLSSFMAVQYMQLKYEILIE